MPPTFEDYTTARAYRLLRAAPHAREFILRFVLPDDVPLLKSALQRIHHRLTQCVRSIVSVATSVSFLNA